MCCPRARVVRGFSRSGYTQGVWPGVYLVRVEGDGGNGLHTHTRAPPKEKSSSRGFFPFFRVHRGFVANDPPPTSPPSFILFPPPPLLPPTPPFPHPIPTAPPPPPFPTSKKGTLHTSAWSCVSGAGYLVHQHQHPKTPHFLENRD